MKKAISELPTLTHMTVGSITVLSEPHQAHKIVKCRCLFFPKRTHIVSGYVPAGSTVVRPKSDGNYYGHSRRVSEFVPTKIEGYLPFMKCFGGTEYTGGVKTLYKPNVPIKPHFEFDSDVNKHRTSGIHVVDTLETARELY